MPSSLISVFDARSSRKFQFPVAVRTLLLFKFLRLRCDSNPVRNPKSQDKQTRNSNFPAEGFQSLSPLITLGKCQVSSTYSPEIVILIERQPKKTKQDQNSNDRQEGRRLAEIEISQTHSTLLLRGHSRAPSKYTPSSFPSPRLNGKTAHRAAESSDKTACHLPWNNVHFPKRKYVAGRKRLGAHHTISGQQSCET